MTSHINDISLNKAARIAGALILIMSPVAFFSMMYVPSALIVPGDAATTASNIMANEGLFRFGIFGESLVFLIEIVVVVMLYVLLKPVSKTLSLIAAFFRLAMVVIQGINLLNNFNVLTLLSGADYLKVFEPAELHALVLLFLNAHEYVANIWGLFFALHLFFLGYLVYKSGYLPRILGIGVIIAGLGYLLESFGIFLLPKYEEIFTGIVIATAVIGEFPFFLWLLFKGVKDQ